MKAGVPGFIGPRLTQAREAMGLTITSLADLLGVSKQAVSQYERSIDAPGPEVFDRIRATLHHEAHFFLRPVMATLQKNTCFYRSMAATTKSARTKAEVWQLWVRELISYLSEFVVLPRPQFPAFDFPTDPNRLGMDTIERYAAELRQHWKLGELPIANLVTTAEAYGVLTVRHALDAETLDALSEWLEPEDVPLVVLNIDKRVAVRSRLDLAHELGHIAMHRRIAEVHLKRPETFRLLEEQAFRFGAAVLLPEHAFLDDLYSISLDGLRALKPRWKVSIAMMIERLRHLEVITEERHRKLRINYSSRQWNRDEPFDDEIELERPKFIAKAIRMLITENVQNLEEITLSTGFARFWIERLLDLSPDTLSPIQSDIKILEFKRRA